MAELNLKQIVDKLNTEFTGEHRKLVFWYDEAADFADDIYSTGKCQDLQADKRQSVLYKIFSGMDG